MRSRSWWAVIVAAGAGRRLGGGLPKALVPLGGKPLFIHSLETFLSCPGCLGAVVVTPPGMPEKFHVASGGMDALFVEGGAERSESVARGVEAVPAAGEEDPLVLVHDAARPLVGRGLVERVVETAEEKGNAVPAVPLSDTVKEAEGGRFLRTLARDRLVAVQTPQAFRRSQLLEWFAATPGPHPDESTLAEKAGVETFCVMGDRHNIKVTYPEDLRLAEALLSDSPD